MNESIRGNSKPEEKERVAPEEQQRQDQKKETISVGNVIILLGSILLTTGLLLPWVSYKGGSFLTSAFQFHAAGYVVLVTGIGMGILSIAGILKRLENIQVMTLGAVVCLLLTAYFYIEIISSPKLWGSGFIISGIGIVVILFGTCFMGLNPKAREN